MSRFPPVAASAVLGLAVLLGGCGQSASEKADLARARVVVERFASASDASACSLLTDKAVKALYGKFKASPEVSRANCARRSKRFRGEPVTITRSELLDAETIKINALDQDGKFSYQVNLRKRRDGSWRIELISQAKVTT
ncbi:MAG: hypothetical protein QOH76_3396 [Thermoleophilaceae bacterium]|jgi:hypothetical protein|nr:hypothetical protein [Thermoleophilaceae bacterium]